MLLVLTIYVVRTLPGAPPHLESQLGLYSLLFQVMVFPWVQTIFFACTMRRLVVEHFAVTTSKLAADYPFIHLILFSPMTGLRLSRGSH